ncbi:MAG: suppressor of fused domain protein [Hamadaea sp.]|nr:suppressor of fused domain protein [Hamadaea sp.]
MSKIEDDGEFADDAAPGWDAISVALDRLYPGVEPKHYGTLIGWRLGGPDPLDGMSFYAREDHWHLVSFGMSELYAKEGDNPDESGWGFEFTFRVGRAPDENEPPMWAANFLQNLARYVYKSGNTFAPGHHMNLNGPISLAREETAIRAITFTDDPELPPIDTPNGRMRFLQVVGLTLGEYAAIEGWSAAGVLGVLQPRLPLFVTDLDRADLLTDPAIAAAVAEGSRRDGSSTSSLYVEEAGWDLAPDGGLTVRFGASAAARIANVLRGTLPFGRGLDISSADSAVIFNPGDDLRIEDAGSGLVVVTLPPPAVTALAGLLRPVAGTAALPGHPQLRVDIVKSFIRDQDGTIVEEIG